jgi:HSP20 family protein
LTNDSETKGKSKESTRDSLVSSRVTEANKTTPAVYFDEVDRLLERFREELFSSGWSSFRNYMLPKDIRTPEVDRFVRNPLTNVTSDDKNFYVRTEIPGLDKTDLEISINDRVLRIEGETQDEEEIKDDVYLRREYYSSKFYRSYTLPEDVNEDKIEASLDKGILQIKLPKTKTGNSKTKKIKIK